MVPSDWDLAPKCVCGPNFISYLIGESPILSATRLVCVSDVLELLAVWQHNKPKTKNHSGTHRFVERCLSSVTIVSQVLKDDLKLRPEPVLSVPGNQI